eukprot:FR743921.1.p2 GENE.FR743921.1~~FR743921.1.p2  ORF type:complete len:114 (+),score=20.05 FR743921.1:523-864(+)
MEAHIDGLNQFFGWVCFRTLSLSALGFCTAIILPGIAEKKKKKKAAAVSDSQGPEPRGSTSSRAAATAVELPLLFPLVRVNCALGVIMVIAVSCVKIVSPPHPPQNTSPEHKR